jgi:hypothetical protein
MLNKVRKKSIKKIAKVILNVFFVDFQCFTVFVTKT